MGGEICNRSAAISNDGLYRYFLAREWADGPTALFVMLNPSTADAHQDDATIRRCTNYARTWGCGALAVVNLYAWRATDPTELKRAADPVGGPEADRHIVDAAALARATGGPVVAAWGTHARPDRVAQVLALPGVRPLSVLALTKGGHPHHPLRLAAALTPQPWTLPVRTLRLQKPESRR